MKSVLSLTAATLALGFFAMPVHAGATGGGSWPDMTTAGSAQALPDLVQRVVDDDDRRDRRRHRRWRDDDDDDNRGRRGRSWRGDDDDDNWRQRRNWRW